MWHSAWMGEAESGLGPVPWVVWKHCDRAVLIHPGVGVVLVRGGKMLDTLSSTAANLRRALCWLVALRTGETAP